MIAAACLHLRFGGPPARGTASGVLRRPDRPEECGLPALLMARRDLDIRSQVALGFLSATELPLAVAIAAIGVKSGRLRSATAASLVGAGMVGVLFFPVTALTLRRLGAPGQTLQG